MTDRLAQLVADPARAAQVPPEAIPAVLSEVGAQEARLSTVKAILAARLAAPSAPTTARPEDDLIADAEEVARIVRRSTSWVRKNGHTLPGFRQPGGKGTRVAWSRRALEEWASSPPS